MNTKRISAAAGAAVLVVLGSATGAMAAYEAPSIDLQLNPISVVGGQSFTATATANIDCDSWVLTFTGPTTDGSAGGSGSEASTTFSTTAVDAVEIGTVVATCNYDDAAPTARAAAPASLSASADVTITPAGVAGPAPVDTDNGGGLGGLPSTGGPNLWLAVGGATLTLAGAGAVLRSRRASA